MRACTRCGGAAARGEVRTCGDLTAMLCADCALDCEVAEESAREDALRRFLQDAERAEDNRLRDAAEPGEPGHGDGEGGVP